MTDAELAARSRYNTATRVVDYGPRATHSEATDCRAWWPACTDYQPKEPDHPDPTGPDRPGAAR